MAVLRLFAAARIAAGTGHDEIAGATVAQVLDAAARRYGEEFRQVLAGCQIWLNGEVVPPGTAVGDADEIGVLPPVSGGRS